MTMQKEAQLLYLQVPRRVYDRLLKDELLTPLDDKYGLLTNPTEAADVMKKNFKDVNGAEFTSRVIIEKSKETAKIYVESRSRLISANINSYLVSSDSQIYEFSAILGALEIKPAKGMSMNIYEAYALDRVHEYGVDSVRFNRFARAKAVTKTDVAETQLALEKSTFLESAAKVFSDTLKDKTLNKTDLDREFRNFDKEIRKTFSLAEKLETQPNIQKDPSAIRAFYSRRLKQLERPAVLHY